MRRSLILFGLGLLIGCAQAAEHWELQFFYDKDNSALTITDLKFPSARRGIAIGHLTENGKSKPTALITSDGGATWTLIKLKQEGFSLFFLDESVGWMVTRKAIWKTVESGRSWKKVGKSPRGVVRVYFLDENHGWAVGSDKGIYETVDGGKNWNRLPVVDEVESSPEHTSFTWITFHGRAGMIVGASSPPRAGTGQLPDWMVPERASRHREWPRLNILVETRDGGARWRSSTTSMFGRITRVRLGPDGLGLGLVEFFDEFDWPSEVFRLDWRTGKSTRVFRRKDRAITDVVLPAKGSAFLAGFEPAGRLVRSPIPGKLRILQSKDLTNWQEMDVDYRAVAHRAMLATAGEKHIWVATDTGMILRLAGIQE